MRSGVSPMLVPITGNTFPVKDQLRRMGGRWSSAQKCWLVPADKAEEAKRLVPAGSGRPAVSRAARTCKDCGARINYGVYCGKCEYR